MEEGHSVRFLIVHSTMKVVSAAKLKRLEYDESELLSSPVVSCLRSGMSHEDSTASNATKKYYLEVHVNKSRDAQWSWQKAKKI